MPAVNELSPVLLEERVAKKKGGNAPQPELRQVNIRLTPDLYTRVEDTAEALSLDVAQFLRMVIRRSLPEYESQAAEVRRAEGRGQADTT